MEKQSIKTSGDQGKEFHTSQANQAEKEWHWSAPNQTVSRGTQHFLALVLEALENYSVDNSFVSEGAEQWSFWRLSQMNICIKFKFKFIYLI